MMRWKNDGIDNLLFWQTICRSVNVINMYYKKQTIQRIVLQIQTLRVYVDKEETVMHGRASTS